MNDEPRYCKTDGCSALVFGDETHCKECVMNRRRARYRGYARHRFNNTERWHARNKKRRKRGR